ncbi:hypothetical protein K503DRAFT_796964 [Rhizopogon vinicolor AM-OR11-026]|uniref:Uncharacterized protein n=1 Tax=Rhizopogon vinicolor AM-OR11-026 TaxID=1314800 RepID=A0A1B7NCX6_9AGAM|nr:hypothetical protein K503DRAFT_796964 [Rhizopogon vinicolor AM-OR11-026]
MFARLSRHSARWLDVRVEHALFGHDDAISVDVNVLTCLDLSWYGLCERTIEPMYRGLKSVVEEDLDTVARLLSELEPIGEELEQRNENLKVPSQPQPQLLSNSRTEPCPDVSLLEPPKRKRRRSSTLVEPLIIKPTHPSAPTIIVSPCPPQPRETSCWVPYQDASFGTRLTVPTYTPLNGAFPPLVAPLNTDNRVDNWKYLNGHWSAVLPTQDEQCRRGLYSRSVRRSRLRPPSCRSDI